MDIFTKFLFQIEKAGLPIVRTNAPLNVDCFHILLSDRCRLKDRKQIYMSFAITGLDLMQGEVTLEYRVRYLCADYNNLVKDYGGFERADLPLQTKSSNGGQEWDGRKDGLLLLSEHDTRVKANDGREQAGYFVF